METSLRFFVIVLLAATPSESAPTSMETEAEVVETPQRILTVQPLATFNHGKPFLAERDPVTGAFDLRTTPVNADDYIYEEFDESGESIDRKDDSSRTSNHIISIPTKDSELHKFLNLPVHYSTASKYPLISSSYANTKIQGHGASNHRPATSTPSTVPPSYYPHKSTSTSSLSTTTIATTTTSTTTNRPSTTYSSTTVGAKTTAKSTTTPPPLPAYEYEYEYDYEQPNKASSSEPPKSDFDFMSFFNFGGSETSTTLRSTIRTTARPTTMGTTTRLNEMSTTSKGSPIIGAGQETKVSQWTTTQLPSTTSPKPKVENEPKPSVTGSSGATTSRPLSPESTMIAIKTETVSNKTATEDAEVTTKKQSEGETKPTEVIGMKPPLKFPDSEMKPPPRFGDRIEPTRIEDSGWKGRPDIVSTGLQSAKIPAKPTTSLYTPPHSNSHVRPFEPKPEGSNQVKYSANRPHELTSQKPIEFHQHLVAKVNPALPEDEDDLEMSVEPENKAPGKDGPTQIVVAISSTTQGSQDLSSPATIIMPEKTTTSPTPSKENRPPVLTFPEVEAPNPQGYGAGQVYHATVNNEKPAQLPAATYPQRPPVYSQQPQPAKDKAPGGSSPERDESFVFNKISYRPQPGLISSYQPHTHQPPHQSHQGQVQQLPSKPVPGYQPSPQHQQNYPPQQNYQTAQGPHIHHQTKPPQPSYQPQPQPTQSQPSYQSHSQPIQQPQGFVHQAPNPQNGPQQGSPFTPPQFQRVPQPFTAPQGNAATNQDENRPVVWPPKGKPTESQKVPQFTFFPRPDRPAGVGSVEAVRPPPRAPSQGSVAVSSGGGDTQSYSLQTSFSIGMPSGHGDDSKVAQGSVSAVPLHQPVPSVAGPLPTQAQPQHAPVPANTIKYPPPPWEANLNKPYKEPLKRKPLPNILPQFRPNAKVGTVEPSGPHLMGVNYLREPIDRLQPPPRPHLPQSRPVHRSDEHHQHQHHQHFPQVRPVAAYLRAETPAPPSMLPPQPVHRRNGVGTKVTTLQMMQSPPPVTRKSEEPVMVVYPSNIEEASTVKNWRLPTPDFSADDEFPHDLEDARTKDTPILKEKPAPPKPPMKVEFPYPLEKPLPNGEIKEYQAYVPTSPAPEKVVTAEEGLAHHRLQDYHPALGLTSTSSAPTKRLPVEGEFGWSVIGSRSDDDMTTTDTAASSTTGPMAPPQLTGGFRPIPAPSLE